MLVSSVDPRDQTWEVTHPSYRVYFHNAHGAAEELEITGADVSEIIGWAEPYPTDSCETPELIGT